MLRDEDAAAPVAPAAGLGDLDELAAGAARRRRARSTVDVDDARPVPAPVHAAGYRIVQEALTNVLRHARASHVRVRVARDGDAVRVEVADDGDGRAAAPGGAGSGCAGCASAPRRSAATLERRPGGRRRLARARAAAAAARA